jgi:hypothetical protein
MPSQADYTALLIGAGALLLLAKWGIPKIPNPLPAVGKAVTKTADELTGGLQKSQDESLTEYFFEYDVPFSDKRIPLVPPGLRRDKGNIYTTEGQYTRMDIAEPDQSWGGFLSEIDLPGLEPYDLRHAPGDIYSRTLGKGLKHLPGDYQTFGKILR